jgi:hypothetical protein
MHWTVEVDKYRCLVGIRIAIASSPFLPCAQLHFRPENNNNLYKGNIKNIFYVIGSSLFKMLPWP